MVIRSVFSLLLLIGLCSCIEQIDGFVGKYEDLLVVDGLITNESIPYEIYLSRTTTNITETPVKVENAIVTVEDDMGNSIGFVQVEPGKYVSPEGQFRGEIDRSYRLAIKTKEGDEYQSEWCKLNEPGVIDSVYYQVEKYRSTIYDRELNGLALYVDGKGSDKEDNFLKWTFQEDWKFRARYPNYYVFLPDDTYEVVSPMDFTCWKSNSSTKVMIHSTKSLTSNRIDQKLIQSIHPADNDRLSVRYSILVKQLGLSEKEYTFWKNLSQSDQETYDLFGTQPYSIVGNIKNLKDEKEPVLGYFQVAGVTSKRIYISSRDISILDVRNFFNNPECGLDTIFIDDDNCCTYEIYEENYLDKRRGFMGPVFNDFTGDIIALVFGYRKCSDCTVSGSINPPDFWEE